MDWKNWFRRPDRDERELDEEIQAHLAIEARERMEAGEPEKEAWRGARRDFGNVPLIKDVTREMWGWNSWDRLRQDVRYALRGLGRSPGFAAVALVTLALGIGANTAIFSVLNAVLIRELPVQRPEELLRVAPLNERGEDLGFSYPLFLALRRSQQVFASVYAATQSEPMDLVTAAGARKINVQLVSGEYFSTLGVQPRFGRAITEDDNQIGKAHRVAVISNGFWERQFGRDSSILGRSITINRQQLAVMGVAPPGFFGDTVGGAPDVWAPVALLPQLHPGREILEVAYVTFLHVLGRMQPGVEERKVRAALAVNLKQIQSGPDPDGVFRSITRFDAEPASRGLMELQERFSQPLRLLMGIAGLVLLLACANIANLLLARSTTRQKEMAVRLATGAPRLRIFRQLITESLLLAGFGGLAGVLVGFWGSAVLVNLVSSPGAPVTLDVGPDAHVLGFTLAASFLTGLLFGVGPAMRAMRTDPMAALRGAANTPRGDLRIGKMLVTAQVAICLLVLVGAGLLVRTLRNLRTVDIGFARDGVLQVEIDTAAYQPAQLVLLLRRISERVDRLPGVRSSSFAFIGLVEGQAAGYCCVVAEGQEPKPKGDPHDRRVRFNMVMPGYFASTGMTLVAGRDFNTGDLSSGNPKAVILNETMARKFFGGANPLGKHIGRDEGKLAMEVIGIVKDAKYEHVREAGASVMYVLPEAFFGRQVRFLFARTAGDPAMLAATVVREMKTIDPTLPVGRVATVRELIDDDLIEERLVAKLTGAFGVLALVLAAVGLYGVISYAVARRTGEIGIRMALGAGRGQVLWMVLREVLVVTVFGVCIGSPAAFGATRLISSLLFGLKPTDPATILMAIVVLGAVASIAGYLPALRATRVDPMSALRYE